MSIAVENFGMIKTTIKTGTSNTKIIGENINLPNPFSIEFPKFLDILLQKLRILSTIYDRKSKIRSGVAINISANINKELNKQNTIKKGQNSNFFPFIKTNKFEIVFIDNFIICLKVPLPVISISLRALPVSSSIFNSELILGIIADKMNINVNITIISGLITKPIKEYLTFSLFASIELNKKFLNEFTILAKKSKIIKM